MGSHTSDDILSFSMAKPQKTQSSMNDRMSLPDARRVVGVTGEVWPP